MKTEWIVFAGIAGFGAGVLLGLAFAPQSGKETRELVERRTRDGFDQLTASGRKAGGQLKDLADKGKALATRGKEQVADALQAGKQADSSAAARG